MSTRVSGGLVSRAAIAALLIAAGAVPVALSSGCQSGPKYGNHPRNPDVDDEPKPEPEEPGPTPDDGG